VVAYGVSAAVLLYCVSSTVLKSYAWSFFAIPFFVGIVVGVLSLKRPFRNAWITLGIALVLAIVTMREGVVCVIYSLPVILPELFAGAACGWVIRRHVRARRNQYWVAALAIVASAGWQTLEGITDDPPNHPVHEARAAIAVAAPPDRVFAALTARELAVAPRWPWFLRIGLPIPQRMVVDEARPGGSVRVLFSQGTAFAHVTDFDPGRAFAFTIDRYEIQDAPFHITRLGRGPHYGLRAERVEDWLTFLDIRYTLQPDANGGTLLQRRIQWRRHLAPAFYFGWLQQTIIERGQTRLLELLRERLERPGQSKDRLAASDHE
jgi:hypothetical protein